MKPIELRRAEYVDRYRLKLLFGDGKTTTVDFEGFLKQSKHPDIRKYLRKALFRKFDLKSGHLTWNDFDMVFPLAELYAGGSIGTLERRRPASLNARSAVREIA
ncbi:MAG: DUF2442 domain-containing protein [Planctomycetota bacterium]|nr:DUF2442 domain-containing protein [Planctomycetota bacterium]